MCFNAAKVYECAEGSRISSVRWNYDGSRLAVALCPSSQILFFSFDKESGTLSQLGLIECPIFPANTAIVLECHPEVDYMFACASDVDSIVVWSPPVSENAGAEDIQIGLTIEHIVPVESGQFGMQFNKKLQGLFTFEKGIWRFWSFSEYEPNLLICIFKSVDEHSTIRRRFKSTLISFASSINAYLAASGGSNDTMIIHKKTRKKKSGVMDWVKAKSRDRNVCYGEAKCLKFNPKNDLSMRVAMGGDSGYIHIWAVYPKTSRSMTVNVPDRRNEQFFYTKLWNPRNVNLPSTSSGDDAEDDEVEVEEAHYDDGGGDDDEDDDDNDDDGDDNDDDDDDDDDDSEQGSRILQNVGATVGSTDSQGEKNVEKDLQFAQELAGLAIGGRSGSGDYQSQESAIGALREITHDASGIAHRIEADDTVSPEEMLALCRKILQCSSEIAKAITREDTSRSSGPQ